MSPCFRFGTSSVLRGRTMRALAARMLSRRLLIWPPVLLANGRSLPRCHDNSQRWYSCLVVSNRISADNWKRSEIYYYRGSYSVLSVLCALDTRFVNCSCTCAHTGSQKYPKFNFVTRNSILVVKHYCEVILVRSLEHYMWHNLHKKTLFLSQISGLEKQKHL